MKIRIDFVTNSSSVSYIVTLHPDMAEFRKFKTKNYGGDLRIIKIYEALFQDITQQGTKMSIAGSTVLAKRYDFEKKPDCKYDTSFDKPIEEVDFSSMSDDDLWAYIYGECLVNGRLSNEIRGFGSVQVPRDEVKFQEKRCRVVPCEHCDRRNTPSCFKANTPASTEELS